MGNIHRLIYLDLDGVFFRKRYAAGLWFYELLKKHQNFQVNRLIKQIGDRILQEVPMKNDAFYLMEYLESYAKQAQKKKAPIQINFLTSAPQEDSKILFYKKIWLEKNNLPYPLLFTKNPTDKTQWATKDSLLIDDMFMTVKNFQMAGGAAIHYKNFLSFKKQFENL